MSTESVQESLDRFYARQVGRMAWRLRDAAERIEREGNRYIGHDGSKRHVLAAAGVMHEIYTMHGNLPTEALLSAAVDAQTNDEAAS